MGYAYERASVSRRADADTRGFLEREHAQVRAFLVDLGLAK